MRDLVALSRLERARQADARPDGRMYTSEDLARFEPEAAAVRPASSAARAGDGQEPPARAELEARRAALQELEDRVVGQRLDMVEIRNRITGPLGANEERNRARAALAEAALGLDRLQAELERARAELAALESNP